MIGDTLAVGIAEAQASRDYDTIIALCEQHPERLTEMAVGIPLLIAYTHSFRSDEGLELAEMLYPCAVEEDDKVSLQRIAAFRACILARQSRLSSAEASIAACFMYGLTGDSSVYPVVRSCIGTVLSQRGRWLDAVPEFHRVLAVAQLRGDRLGVGAANHNIGTALTYCGRFQEAEQHFLRSTDYYHTEGTLHERVFSASERSLAVLGLGDLRRCEAMAFLALHRCRVLSPPSSELLQHAVFTAARVASGLGRVEQAGMLAAEAMVLADATGDLCLQGEILEVLGSIAEQDMDPDRAKRLYHEAMRRYDVVGADGFRERLLSSAAHLLS